REEDDGGAGEEDGKTVPQRIEPPGGACVRGSLAHVRRAPVSGPRAVTDGAIPRPGGPAAGSPPRGRARCNRRGRDRPWGSCRPSSGAAEARGRPTRGYWRATGCAPPFSL